MPAACLVRTHTLDESSSGARAIAPSLSRSSPNSSHSSQASPETSHSLHASPESRATKPIHPGARAIVACSSEPAGQQARWCQLGRPGGLIRDRRHLEARVGWLPACTPDFTQQVPLRRTARTYVPGTAGTRASPLCKQCTRHARRPRRRRPASLALTRRLSRCSPGCTSTHGGTISASAWAALSCTRAGQVTCATEAGAGAAARAVPTTPRTGANSRAHQFRTPTCPS